MRELTPYQKWRMCGRKQTFDRRRNANRAAKKRGMRAYGCPVCFKFHLSKIDDREGILKHFGFEIIEQPSAPTQGEV